MRLATLAAGLALLLAPTADAATTCLTDPFTLDDQRALAAPPIATRRRRSSARSTKTASA
jgi:hypothetical protein